MFNVLLVRLKNLGKTPDATGLVAAARRAVPTTTIRQNETPRVLNSANGAKKESSLRILYLHMSHFGRGQGSRRILRRRSAPNTIDVHR